MKNLYFLQKERDGLAFYFKSNLKQTPVYNFINGRFVDESTDLKPFSQHLFLCVFRCFWRKWPKISGCEYPDLIQNEIPVHSLCGIQKKFYPDTAEVS